jgi:hypothetical protein
MEQLSKADQRNGLCDISGSSPSKDEPNSVNNVYAFDETTSQPTVAYLNVLGAPGSGSLAELRGLWFANGYLYVANGSKER